MPLNPANKKEPEKRIGHKEHLKPLFLEKFKVTGFLHATCDEISIDPKTVWRWRKEDPAFDEKYQECKLRNVETLEHIGMARAMKKSDLLMIFFLKAMNPEKYKERFAHELDSKTIDILVTQFIGAVKKHAHEVCPHCKSHLGLPGKIAKELENLSASLVGNK